METKKPLVSVIVPCHNRLSFLYDCLVSVSLQKYPQIELIVSDDASEPGVVKKLMNNIKWPKSFSIQLIRSEIKQGPGLARELGRQKATGEYIAYLDSDDLWHADFVLKQVNWLLAHPESDMSYCIARQFKVCPLGEEKTVFSRSDQNFNTVFPHLFSKRPWATACCLWTRAATEKIGSWCSAWIGEDFAYDWKAGCLDIKVAHLPKTLCYIRRGKKQEHLTHKSKEEFAVLCLPAYLKILSDMFNFNKINNDPMCQWLLGRLIKQAFRLLQAGKNTEGEAYFSAIRKLMSARSELSKFQDVYAHR